MSKIDAKKAITILKQTLEKTTPGKWIVRNHPYEDDAFIEAPEKDSGRDFGYEIEILGDDKNGYDKWLEDMEFIVAAHELLPIIIKEIDLQYPDNSI